jgi:Flp pilus assembly pilin Flp
VNVIFTRLFVLYQQRERGQTMAEYVVVLAVISVTLLLALSALSGAIRGELGRVTADI